MNTTFYATIGSTLKGVNMGVLKEAFVPLVVCVYWLVYFLSTRGLPRETTVFPYFLMVVMPLVGVMILIGEYRKTRSTDPKDAGKRRSLSEFAVTLKNPAILYGLSVFYLILFIYTNFLISTTVYLTGTMMIFKEPWLKSAIIGVGLAVSLYVVFGVIFMVPL